MSRERPILFNGAMVRAILAGQKTQTRRVVKEVKLFAADYDARWHPHVLPPGGCCPKTWTWWEGPSHGPSMYHEAACPFGKPGDRLWVRETWGIWDQGFDTVEESSFVVYRADTERPEPKRWRPSIHMPREHCRLLLEITDVRVERLQAISEADALAEGAMEWASEQDTPIRDLPGGDERIAFKALWESTGGDWDANPWVWVIEFKRVQS